LLTAERNGIYSEKGKKKVHKKNKKPTCGDGGGGGGRKRRRDGGNRHSCPSQLIVKYCFLIYASISFLFSL
jgi:hypothetical protein